MTTKINISKSNNNFKIKNQPKVPVASYICNISSISKKLRKFHIKINDIEHNINSKDGIINTGIININNLGYIYNVDEDNDKSIVNKEYVDTHGGGIDPTKPLHLEGQPSLTTTGHVIIGYNKLDESQNKIIIDSSNGNIDTKGIITSNSIILQNGTIETVNDTDNSLINRKYYYDHMSGLNPYETLYLYDDPSLITTGNIIIKNNNENIIILNSSGDIITKNINIETGILTSQPISDNNITNKEYVDNKISNDCILKNETNEQTITCPLNLENNAKITKLLIPVNN